MSTLQHQYNLMEKWMGLELKRLQLWKLGKKEVAVLTLLKVYLHIIKPCIPLVLEGNLYIDVCSILYKPKWKKQLNQEMGQGGQLYGIPVFCLLLSNI